MMIKARSYFKKSLKRTLVLLTAVLFLSGLSSAAEDLLSLAKQQETRGWALKLEKGGLKDSHLSFLKVVEYYRRFIGDNRLTIVDLETRRFTALDARKRIIDIFRFGLKNKQQAKKELRGLLSMYKGLAGKYPVNKINARVESKISQIKDEFDFNAYLAQINGKEIVCLLTDDAAGSELIIYDQLTPVARAKIEKIITIEGSDKDKVALARVYRINPAVKLSPCLYARTVGEPVAASTRLSAMSGQCYNMGKKFFERLKFEEAEKYLNRALKYDPDNVPALNKLGLVYFSYGNISGARRYYLMALEADPAYIEAYINLAGAYLSGSDFPVDTNNVFDMLEGAVAANRNYPRAYYWLGHLLDDFMFFKPAKEYYLQGQEKIAVLETDNWYKQTSLAKKLSSPGQLIWDTANICLSDKEPMLNSSVYAFDELLKMDPNDLSVKKRLKGILAVCPFARDGSIYKDVISHRNLGLKLQKENRLKEAIDEMRISLYLDQLASSKFRRCISRVPRIKID
jgi:tetratricopeptide (TPR) repeat protein